MTTPEASKLADELHAYILHNYVLAASGGRLADTFEAALLRKFTVLRLQPGKPDREEVARKVQNILANGLTINGLEAEIDGIGPASFKIADLLTPSHEAGTSPIRADRAVAADDGAGS